ncbi:hypothetical protein ACFX2J_025209 [Malus domestica]
MGQSSSLPEAPAEHSPREISTSRRFSFKTVAIASSSTDEDSELYGEVTQGRDYTSDLPDECLASIFHFLCAGDRKRSSLVCHRWLRVDGQSRHRLSINAQAGLLPFLPALFARFDSVTKLALRCDRKSISLDDDALVLISIRCKNLTRLKLRGCREITDLGMATFAQNCKGLKKLSCGSCMFGAKAMNAVFEHCPALEELSVKRIRGVHDGSEPIGDKIASSSLKSITLKEILSGQCFGPLVVGSKNLKTLKLIRCLGDWDTVLEKLGNGNQGVIEIHLERLQVTDLGLSAISKCSNLEVLHIVKAPECSNFGLICVAENCKLLRKLHIDGWRTNRIGDEGLIAISKECPNIQELVLIGVNPTSLSLTAIASNCQKLERLALCGSGSIGDAEFACIAAKCVALKKLCIKGCPISNPEPWKEEEEDVCRIYGNPDDTDNPLREDEEERNGARATRRAPGQANRNFVGDVNGEDAAEAQGIAGAVFDGLDDADGTEDVPFDELGIFGIAQEPQILQNSGFVLKVKILEIEMLRHVYNRSFGMMFLPITLNKNKVSQETTASDSKSAPYSLSRLHPRWQVVQRAVVVLCAYGQ